MKEVDKMGLLFAMVSASATATTITATELVVMPLDNKTGVRSRSFIFVKDRAVEESN